MEEPRAQEVREPWRLAVWSSIVLVMILSAYAARAFGGDPIDDALYRYETALTGLFIYAFLFGILLLAARGLPARSFFALRRPPSWSRALGFALVSYVVIFVGAGLILVALDAGDEQGLAPEEWESGKLGPFLANFVVVALAAPIVEELMYRGAGITLLERFGTATAVVVTAVAFGLAHGLVLALPALVLFGLVTAWLRLRTGSVLPPMLVHAAFNATSLIVSVSV